ncbi:MAG TPA: 30S ribosomal protein S4 [Candidatus Thermoplasmatota archaeon]|nr:30S ribosomal protein S4 [Candidatus Thermoplasmatota archaeon]
MGQPKFPRKKYDTPGHPWKADRFKAENEVVAKFGLKNKKELWKAQTRLREIRAQARGLVSATRNPADTQAAREAQLLLRRLNRQGYLGDNATLNDVLGLDLERILNRRLQSQVYLKGLARTPNQARQFVSHGTIMIGDRRVNVPSYVVRRGEEELIHFDPTAAVADENHPARPKAAGFDAMGAQPAGEAPAAAEAAPEGGAQ